MKYLKIALVLSISVFALSSCKKDFEKLNTNVNAPVNVQPDVLLRQVIYDLGDNISYEGFVAGNCLSQHFSMVDFNQFDRHNLSQPQLGGNPWPFLYRNLRDNEIILNKSLEESVNNVYEGPARILKAYIAMQLTDIYGDVPYFEAGVGASGKTNPKYDKQEDVYLRPNGILNQLDLAISAIEKYVGAQTLKGDILFSGKLDAWKKFAGSLKIKALVRISGRDADIQLDVKKELSNLVASGNFMTVGSDDAKFQFTASQPNSFRMQKLRVGDFNQYVMSITSDTLFQKYNDPRFKVFFRGSGNDATVYNGIINGIDNSKTVVKIADYSLPGTIFRESTGGLKCNFMSAWETNLLLAEAALNGLLSGSAQSYYETGVTQAFAYWNTTMPATYLTAGPAAFNTTDGFEQIITQKWLGNIINGYESWIEFRRTGFPKLLPVAASLNSGLIPVRMPYPSDESALNTVNFAAAAAATSGNSVNAKVWWDIK